MIENLQVVEQSIINGPDCIPNEFPCDQHYGEHWSGQPPTRWVIELATSLVRFRVISAGIFPTDESANHIVDAAYLLQSLLNTRWRNITREPPQFYPHDDTTEPSTNQVESTSSGRQLLLQLGLLKKEQPLIRRRV